MLSVQANELKKGTVIVHRDGTRATLMDNKKGNVRTVETPNLFGSMSIGSAYIKDYAFALIDGEYYHIALSVKQKKDKAMIEAVLGR